MSPRGKQHEIIGVRIIIKITITITIINIYEMSMVYLSECEKKTFIYER